MSWDVSLLDPVTMTVLEMDEPFTDGGIHVWGGTTFCELNITYNYSEVYGSLVKDLRNKTVAETVVTLRAFVDKWPHAKPYVQDYWAPTVGNAVAVIKRLLSFADAHPHGVWDVS